MERIEPVVKLGVQIARGASRRLCLAQRVVVHRVDSLGFYGVLPEFSRPRPFPPRANPDKQALVRMAWSRCDLQGNVRLPTLTGIGVTWLHGFQFEIKVIAKLP